MYDGTAHSLLTTLRPEAVQVKKKLVKNQSHSFCFMKMVAAKSFIILFVAAAYIQGTIAGETNNCRCIRLPYNTTIGADVTIWPIKDDVGRCEEVCHDNNAPTKDNTERYSCKPTEMEIKSYPLTGTAKYKTVILKCGYQHISGACYRQSLYSTFFKGTAYSRRHDVGSCVGVCGTNGHECKAVDSRMVAIEGPNGSGELTVPVIKKCGCVSRVCHRVAFREVYKRKSEYGWIEEEKDVGICVGTTCLKICGHCYYEQIKAELCDRHCMSFHKSFCVATNYTTEAAYTGDFKPKKIFIIKRCGCSK